MKRLLILSYLLVSVFTIRAQTTMTPALDTITDAGTLTLNMPSLYFADNNGTFSVGAVATRISGTATGYVILKGSIDGTNYALLNGTSADTFAIANVAGAQTKTWYVTGKKVKAIKLEVIGGGTQSTQIKGSLLKVVD